MLCVASWEQGASDVSSLGKHPIVIIELLYFEVDYTATTRELLLNLLARVTCVCGGSGGPKEGEACMHTIHTISNIRNACK